MRVVYSVTDLPQGPSVYAMYGGKGPGRYVAYVGIGQSLRPQVIQYLVRRDSNVTAGTSAGQLNSDHGTEIRGGWGLVLRCGTWRIR